LTLHVRDITPADAREFASWTYPEPYSMYDASPEDVEVYLEPANDYRTVIDDDGAIVGLCCFGIDARVPGGDYGADALDVGTGMRPELTGQGRGREFFACVIAEARRLDPGKLLRTTVAAYNERARRMVERAGFRETEIFRSPAGREFVVYSRAD